jgi:hypothetical protein
MDTKRFEALGFSRLEILRAIMGCDDGSQKNVQQAAQAVSEDSAFTPVLGKWAVIRGYGSGVHVGKVETVSNSTDGRLCVTLAPKSVRLWRWHCANGAKTLSGVANYGLANDSGTKVETTEGTIVIPDCCEIILVSNDALTSITGSKWND